MTEEQAARLLDAYSTLIAAGERDVALYEGLIRVQEIVLDLLADKQEGNDESRSHA